MAVQKIVLGPFNNVALAGVSTQYNLVAAGPGHYYFNILNAGSGNIAISNANTVSMSDPKSFLLPPNLSFSPMAYGPDGVWVAAGAAAVISVALVPKG